jgi:hypothetical protein
MPHYYFDVRNGRRHADSLGLDCRDDNGAIAKATFIATQIAIDTPQLDQRHVAVLNDAGAEIFQAPIRSKPPPFPESISERGPTLTSGRRYL